MAFNNKIQYIKTQAATRNLNGDSTTEAVPKRRTRIRRVVRLDSIQRQEVARQMRVCAYVCVCVCECMCKYVLERQGNVPVLCLASYFSRASFHPRAHFAHFGFLMVRWHSCSCESPALCSPKNLLALRFICEIACNAGVATRVCGGVRDTSGRPF